MKQPAKTLSGKKIDKKTKKGLTQYLSEPQKESFKELLNSKLTQLLSGNVSEDNQPILKEILKEVPFALDKNADLSLAGYFNTYLLPEARKQKVKKEAIGEIQRQLTTAGKTTISELLDLEKELPDKPVSLEKNATNEFIATLAGLTKAEITDFVAHHKGQVMDTKNAEKVFSKDMSKTKLDKINFAKGLLNLTRGDKELSETLFKQTGINSIKDLAKSKSLDWNDVIDTRYGNKLSKKDRLKMADRLEVSVAGSFPTAYVTFLVKKKSSTLTTFLKNNPEADIFSSKMNEEDLKKHDLKGIPAKDRSALTKEIQGYQRTKFLVDDTRYIANLMNSGYTSAHEIVATNRHEFYKNSALPQKEAESTYKKAQKITNETLSTLNLHLEIQRNDDLPFINSSNTVNSFDDIDLQEIFGSLHFCECDHCNSIFSPAAYFVDLLHFIKRNNANALTELKRRRADLWDITLSCDQTNTTQPYLELIIEVLGQYIEDSVTNLPNVPKNIDDILYLPWVNPELPFEPDGINARLLAEELDTSLYEIYSMMEADAAVLVAEYLGFGPETLKWILTGQILPNTSPETYSVELFNALFNLDYEELKSLTESKIGANIILQATKIDTQTYEESVIINLSSATARGSYLKKVFNFLRIYRHLDYTLEDLDLYLDLADNGAPELKAVHLTRLSILVYLKDLFELGNDDLSLFVRGYEALDFSGALDPNDYGTNTKVLLLLGIVQEDFDRLTTTFKDHLTYTAGQLDLSIENMSLLKRNVIWANKTGFLIQDWLLFLELYKYEQLVIDHKWEELIVLVVRYQQIGIPVSLTDFYLNNVQNDEFTFSIDANGALVWINGLRYEGLQFMSEDDAATADIDELKESMDSLAASISTLYGVDDQIINILFGQYETLTVALIQDINKLLDPELEVDVTSVDFLTVLEELNGLDKNLQFLEYLNINGETLDYFFQNSSDLNVDPAKPDSLLNGLYNFSKWMDALKNDLVLFDYLFSENVGITTMTEELAASILGILGMEGTTLITLIDTFTWQTLTLDIWNKFINAIAICNELHWSPGQLHYAMQTEQITNASIEYYRELTLYFEQSLQLGELGEDKIKALEDKVNDQLLEAKRDALVALLQKSLAVNLSSTSKIYEYFLLDSEMSACADVSPIKSAILSVQLFIQRCLMNLEEDASGDKLQFDTADKEEWEWRKNYRVWEVNRKIFLYPENYLDPDLRDNKTPVYDELEGDVQQRDLTLPAIEKTYRKYLKEFSTVAKLTMAGSFWDPENNYYYYFGRTTNEPFKYYYKIYKESTRAWSHWQEIDINIDSDYLAGIVAYGRMYIFWKGYKSYTTSSFIDGNLSESSYYQPVIKYSFMEEDLSWSTPINIEVPDVEADALTVDLDSLFSKFLRVEHVNNEFKIKLAQDINGAGDTIEISVDIDIPENKYIENYEVPYTAVTQVSANSTEDGIEIFIPDLNFTEHFLWNANFLNRVYSETDPIITSSKPLSLLNGQYSTNYTIKNGEKNYQYLFANGGLFPLNSFVVMELSEVIFLEGIDNFLSPDTQLNKTETTDLEIQEDVILHPEDIFMPDNGLDFDGPNGIYFQELYFHIPVTLAKHYNNHQKFAEADYWYRKIFDPTVTYDADHKYWQYTPFRRDMEEQIKSILQDTAALDQYHSDPFNPHAIARLRTSAYPKSVVMAYIDNLLDWGDHLFREDTYESINEAMMLYIIAQQLLGERPRSVIPCDSANETKTFGDIEEFLDAKNEILIEIESFITGNKLLDTSGINIINPSISDNLITNPELYNGSVLDNIPTPDDTIYNDPVLTQSFVQELFCIPWNDTLLHYWDTVEDRMYKIRNCLNIDGEYRELALFEPPIDPNLLVKAKAAGINLSQLTTKDNLMPYRFTFLLDKARSYTAMVHNFGQTMLNTLEKEDGEALGELRIIHERNILELLTRNRENQIEQLVLNRQALDVNQEKLEAGILHYEELISGNIIAGFKNADKRFRKSADLQKSTQAMNILMSALALVPQVGAPTAMTFGGKQLSEAAKGSVKAVKAVATAAKLGAQIIEKYQNQNIRQMGWQQALIIHKKDLEANEISKLTNELRLAVAQRDLEVHEQNIEQNQEVLDFYSEKMSNQALYSLLTGYLTRLFRDAYALALQTSMDAQAAFRFETNNNEAFFVALDNWDSASMGLLATEKLQHQLMQMESSYMEQNQRMAEVRAHVSLAILDPEALLKLKSTGTCDINIPETWFDIHYPGQFKRRIKSVSVSIPCVVGPYVNVAAKFKLAGSRIRVNPNLTDEFIAINLPKGNDRIFTSKAQNDSGLLEFSFRDERYLPFEGAGAESDWEILLPDTFRAFDYNTITDVIFHINYTADYDELFRTEIETNIKSTINILNDNQGLYRVLSLKHEFPNEWYQATSSGKSMSITITKDYFPFFTQGNSLSVVSSKLSVLDPDNELTGTNELSGRFTGASSGSLPLTLEISINEEEYDSVLFLVLNYEI